MTTGVSTPNFVKQGSRFTYAIKTMGCKANIYDSLVLEKELMELGGVRDEATPGVFVLNSCTVTAEADKQSLREVQSIKKKSPGTWAVLSGCYAQVAEDKIKQNPLIDLVVPGSQKGVLRQKIAEHFGFAAEEKLFHEEEIYWGQLPTHAGKTRAFLKIQEGCNDYCTYCIIPYARGKSRSVRMGHILAEAQRLTDHGVKEFVLTGTNIADYGKDLETSLEDLIEQLLTRTTIPRLRLTSLDPSEVTDRLLGLMREHERLMPHFHISLQSPVSRVLRAMKRDYRQEDVATALNRIHQLNPEIFVGMDLIAGFPGETDAEHQEGMAFLKALPWARLHVFPYSEREGTPATRIPDSVAVHVRKQRAKEWMELSKLQYEKFTQGFIGKEVNGVLFETVQEAGGDFFVVGHAANYLKVMARVPARTREAAEALKNTIGNAKITGVVPQNAIQELLLEGVLS